MKAMSARLLPAPAPPPPWSPDNRWLAEWRRRDFLELGALDTAPGSARGHVANVASWAKPDFTEAVRLESRGHLGQAPSRAVIC